MNKKGFTLFELLAVIVVIIVVFLLAIPIVTGIIKYSKFKAFQNSALNAIDAVDYYIANNQFVSIPEEGIDIEDLDSSILKNNNFDKGNIVRRNNQTEIVYLSQGIYCAKGIKSNIIASDKGCGALDESAPTKTNLFLKNETKDYLYIVVAGYDSDSEIIKYELSIDSGKYYSNNSNVFKIKKDNKQHSFKARVTNEANMSLESELKKFKTETETIICTEDNLLENVNSKKNITCKLENQKFNNMDSNIYNMTVTKNETINLENNLTSINIVNIDSLLKDNTPVLDNNMIPIIYNGTDWVVANKNTKYWDYDNKIWANAVTVRKRQDVNDPMSKSRNYYLSSDAIGEKINENDILAYYVWIPKYSYKLWNKSGININNKDKGIQNIEIDFEKSNDTLLINGNFIDHPAFLYENSNGFWVSKYEANISKQSTCSLVPNISNCNTDTFDLYFVPNLTILKNISISNAYQAINKLNINFNRYGISGNAHLITNLEWGAISYLAHSKYGIGNNVSNETTTGNVTGVYNMGMNQEFVMANYNNDLGNNETDNSGFTTLPSTYIDIYKSSTIKGSILGDSILETENWYDSEHKFINGSYPFLIRGNNSIFAFSSSSGSANDNTTFRMSLDKK